MIWRLLLTNAAVLNNNIVFYSNIFLILVLLYFNSNAVGGELTGQKLLGRPENNQIYLMYPRVSGAQITVI